MMAAVVCLARASAASSRALEVNFAPEVAPFLLGLRKEFTTYKLKHTAALRSVYSWRLMEMFAQYANGETARLGSETLMRRRQPMAKTTLI